MNDPLAVNQFYLIISSPTYYLKTKSKEEFEDIKKWGNVLFEGIVKNSDYIHFLVGHTWHKKKIQYLKTAIPFKKNYFYDVENLEIPGEAIKKVKIGGKQKAVVYESL